MLKTEKLELPDALTVVRAMIINYADRLYVRLLEKINAKDKGTYDSSDFVYADCGEREGGERKVVGFSYIYSVPFDLKTPIESVVLVINTLLQECDGIHVQLPGGLNYATYDAHDRHEPMIYVKLFKYIENDKLGKKSEIVDNISSPFSCYSVIHLPQIPELPKAVAVEPGIENTKNAVPNNNAGDKPYLHR